MQGDWKIIEITKKGTVRRIIWPKRCNLIDLEYSSEKLARMAGMTAPLPDTASRKAKTWEQVAHRLFKICSSHIFSTVKG